MRYEPMTGGGLAVSLTLGTGWLIGAAAIGLLVPGAAIACPPSRRGR